MSSITIAPRDLEVGDIFTDVEGRQHYKVVEVVETGGERIVARVRYRDGGEGLREWAWNEDPITVERI